MNRASVVIVGGGTMGLASAWELARRGHAVTVLERHTHLHDIGSHSGYTRVIRQAYHEGSGYVPLIKEADRAWLDLGERHRDDLLVRTGLLEFGPPDDPEYSAAIEACRACDVEHEIFDAAEARARWPFTIPDGWTACLSPSGGFLRIRPCFDALRDEAQAAGATFRYRERVVGVEPGAVQLETGETLRADSTVLAAGVGMPELSAVLEPALTRLRRVLFWIDVPATRRQTLGALPVWGAFTPGGFFYGFPYNTEGVAGLKLAVHTADIPDLDVPIEPERVDRQARAADLAPIEEFARTYFPDAAGSVANHRVCLYCATSSWDFIVDRHPSDPNLIIAGGFSGHGFKFAPAIGRIVADLVAGEIDGPPMPELRLAHHR